jgi:hypothetical protein
MKAEATLPKKSISSWLVPALLLLLGSIAIVSAATRFTLMTQAFVSGVVADDMTRYIDHPFISTLHFLPGIAFLLLGPLQFTPAIRQRWPELYRWSGCAFILSGLLVGVSAIFMAMLFPVIVIRLTTVANITFGIALILSLVNAFCAMLRHDTKRQRAWIIRAYAIGLAVATLRVMFGTLYLITGDVSDAYLPPMVWIAFLFNILAAELIL